MPATSEPRTHAEMLTRMQQANARQAAAARRCRLKKARDLVERSRAAAERMRRTESGRAVLVEFAPPEPTPPAFDPAEVFEILDPEKLAREPKRIIARIAAEHGVTTADIVGQARPAHIVAARFAAIRAVIDEHPNLSTPQIGRIFGDRDHTTILNALRRRGARAGQEAPAWIAPNVAAEILQRIADTHRVTVGQIRGPVASGPILAARNAAIVALAEAEPRLSSAIIGQFVNRSHTAVLKVLRHAGLRPAAVTKCSGAST